MLRKGALFAPPPLWPPRKRGLIRPPPSRPTPCCGTTPNDDPAPEHPCGRSLSYLSPPLDHASLLLRLFLPLPLPACNVDTRSDATRIIKQALALIIKTRKSPGAPRRGSNLPWSLRGVGALPLTLRTIPSRIRTWSSERCPPCLDHQTTVFLKKPSDTVSKLP